MVDAIVSVTLQLYILMKPKSGGRTMLNQIKLRQKNIDFTFLITNYYTYYTYCNYYMLQLLIDVKKEIAYKSEEVWYQLWRYDISFNKYASTDEGRRKFIELFTVNDKNSTRLFGKVNSIYDQPGVIWNDGTKEWYKNDGLHRNNDKPAIIRSDGARLWYQNDKLHRDNDEPAAIYPNIAKYWYQNDKCHRDNDEPAVIRSDGTKEWYQNGNRYYIYKSVVI